MPGCDSRRLLRNRRAAAVTYRGVDPYLMLAAAEGCSPACVPGLLDPEADPERLLREPPPELPPRARARLLDPGLAGVAQEWRHGAAQHGLLLLTPLDPRYPKRLRHMPLRPNALFVRGDVAALAPELALALVGSRTPTPYGMDAARAFAGALAKARVPLWSGLARGIDRAAHACCVRHEVPTVAVLAGGLDRIYPPEHEDLAAAIAARGGCLISEMPPGRRAARGHFPRRNRILAAANAVLVVEAGRTSGSLQTARLAAEQGSTVFAVPGPWDSERSSGCHDLIGEGATLCASPAALLQALGLVPTAAAKDALRLALGADEAAVLACLAGGPRPMDLVQRESRLERSAFLRALFRLEQHGGVLRLAGSLLGLSR